MTALSQFFLNSPSRVILYETVQISHPNFSKIYRIVRNARFGITAKIEDDSFVAFDYYPMKIETTGSDGSLDQKFKFTVGDLGTIIDDELDRIAAADSFTTKPQVIYRAYRSDDLTAPIYGPFYLEITVIPKTVDGFTFEATPIQINQNTTGEIYTLSRFPGLRGFL